MRNKIKGLTRNLLMSSGLYERKQIACVHNILMPCSTISFMNAYSNYGGTFATDHPLIRIDKLNVIGMDRGAVNIYYGATADKMARAKTNNAIPESLVKMFCEDKYVLRISAPTLAVTSNPLTLSRSSELNDLELQFGGGLRNIIHLHIGPYMGDTEGIFFEVVGAVQIWSGGTDIYNKNPAGYVDVHPGSGWVVRPITQDELFMDQCYCADPITDVWTTSHGSPQNFNGEKFENLLGIQCYTQGVRVYTWNREVKIMNGEGIQKKGTGPSVSRYSRDIMTTVKIATLYNWDTQRLRLDHKITNTKANALGESNLFHQIKDLTDRQK